jgi:hypothetical protein
MKLNVVPASTGLTWVKLGITTFFKQPLALGGLFFMFMAVVSVASIVPVIGSVLALALLPAATLGLMVATLEAQNGKFPMPSVLATAFRAGRERMRAMLVLGALYAAGFLLVMAITTMFDGGQFAKMYLLGGRLGKEALEQPDFQTAAWDLVHTFVVAVLACTGLGALARCAACQGAVFQSRGLPAQFWSLLCVRPVVDSGVCHSWRLRHQCFGPTWCGRNSWRGDGAAGTHHGSDVFQLDLFYIS